MNQDFHKIKRLSRFFLSCSSCKSYKSWFRQFFWIASLRWQWRCKKLHWRQTKFFIYLKKTVNQFAEHKRVHSAEKYVNICPSNLSLKIIFSPELNFWSFFCSEKSLFFSSKNIFLPISYILFYWYTICFIIKLKKKRKKEFCIKKNCIFAFLFLTGEFLGKLPP